MVIPAQIQRLAPANWSRFDRRPTWSVVTSRELSKIFGVSLQTINNWKMRDILPPPIAHKKLVGNCNYYRISQIRAWAEARPENDIHWEWVHTVLDPTGETFGTLWMAEFGCRTLPHDFKVEKPPYEYSFIDP